jgi:cyclophilin family peptidyl-prolyl cis-trans isomerase
MKTYIIGLIIVSILILLYIGYNLKDIPKFITNKEPSNIISTKSIYKEQKILEKSNIFFEISRGTTSLGKVEIELFDEDVPLTCNNFRHLCVNGIKNKSSPAYKNTIFNCIIKDFMIQGGDVINNNGTSGYSIYGKYFKDENFNLKHNQEGLISMANCGKDKNNSQFFILTKKNGCIQLDNKYVVFGIIIKGFDIIKKLENTKVDMNNNPIEKCYISNCGLIEEPEDYSIKEHILDDDLSNQKYKISI